MKIPQLTSRQTFAGILLIGLLAMTARNAVDPDLWWHLRTGQWIMETGQIPHADPFSFTRGGQPWISHEWLSEVVFYLIWRSLGSAGLIIFSALVTTAGFFLLYRRCPGKPAAAAAVLTLGALAAAPAWGARPQMFTFTLASLLLWLLERGVERPRLVLAIPPLFLLWLNLHAGFALGPALIAAFGLGLLWEAASGETPWPEIRPTLGRLALVLAACAALVPLNPSGTRLFRYPLDVLRSAEMRSFINEWFPPDFHHIRYVPVFLIWTALLLALAISRRRPRARVLAPLVLTFFAALDAVRHIPLLVLLAVPVIGAALTFDPRPRPLLREASGGYRVVFRAAVLLLLSGFAVTRWVGLARQQPQVEKSEYPAEAISYLRAHSAPSRLFVYYDWGGYAIWKLYPEYRVFIDGRADLYGDGILRDFRRTAEFHSGWRAVLDGQDVETVLVPPVGALAQGLLLDPAWRAQYRDSQAILFVRVRGPA